MINESLPLPNIDLLSNPFESENINIESEKNNNTESLTFNKMINDAKKISKEENENRIETLSFNKMINGNNESSIHDNSGNEKCIHSTSETPNTEENKLENENEVKINEIENDVNIKDMYFVDDIGIFEENHKSAEEDLKKLDESISIDSGLMLHPKKNKILIISNKIYKVSNTTEQDCIDMNWKVKCKNCKRTFPNYSSIPGHKRWCTKDNPRPLGSRLGTLADKIIKNKKIEKKLNETLPVIKFKSNNIHNEIQVKYLGSVFTMNGDIEIEIRRRIGLASGQFRIYNNIFKNKKLSIQNKFRFYDTLILSITLFGCESWPNIKKHSRIISRMITGHKLIIRNNKNQTNFEIEWKIQDDLLLETIKQRKLKYLRVIFSKNGCRKVKELLKKNKLNPFFEFINIENYERK
eukprot:38702_1